MRALLFLIFVGFSTVSLAEEVKIIRGSESEKPETGLVDAIVPRKEEKKETKPQPNGLDNPIFPAVRHCLKLEKTIAEPYRFIAAYNNPLNQEIAANMADFGFMIPEYWSTAQRPERAKFNAVINSKLSALLNFRQEGFKFHGNCEPKLEGEPEEKDGFSRIAISMPLVFDTLERKLTYQMVKQDGYNWVVGSMEVNGLKFTADIRDDILPSLRAEGIKGGIKKACIRLKNRAFNCLN